MKIRKNTFYQLSLLLSNKYNYTKCWNHRIITGSLFLLLSTLVHIKAQQTDTISYPNLSQLPDTIEINDPLIEKEEAEKEVQIFVIKIEPPEFPGGEQELGKYIKRHITYPSEFSDIQGQVIVQFTVDAYGSISDATITQPLHPVLDKAVLDIINRLPRWRPSGVRIPRYIFQYQLPVTFKNEE